MGTLHGTHPHGRGIGASSYGIAVPRVSFRQESTTGSLKRSWNPGDAPMADRHTEYGEGCPPIQAIDAPVVIFMINRAIDSRSTSDLDIYRATQCAWKIGESARANATYALGVSHGVVRGIYRIESWRPSHEGRWCFDGRSSPELAHVVGTSIAHLKAAQGASNPVRLYPNGIPALRDGSDTDTGE